MDLFASPAVCGVAIELIKTACYYGSLSWIILYLLCFKNPLKEWVGSWNTILAQYLKHNTWNTILATMCMIKTAAILEHLLVGGSPTCLCKVYVTCSVLTCLHWFFVPGSHVTSREISRYIPAAFPWSHMTYKGICWIQHQQCLWKGMASHDIKLHNYASFLLQNSLASFFAITPHVHMPSWHYPKQWHMKLVGRQEKTLEVWTTIKCLVYDRTTYSELYVPQTHSESCQKQSSPCHLQM